MWGKEIHKLNAITQFPLEKNQWKVMAYFVCPWANELRNDSIIWGEAQVEAALMGKLKVSTLQIASYSLTEAKL